MTGSHPSRGRDAHGLAVEPLHCPSCGAAVALGDGQWSHCAYCGAPVAIPANYQALKAEQRRLTAERVAAQTAYDVLARPPPLPIRIWYRASRLVLAPFETRIAAGCMLVSLVTLLPLVAGLFGLEIILQALAPTLGIDLIDVYGGATVYGAGAGAAFVLLGVPIILAGSGNQLATARSALQQALAARRPRGPGGPAHCRSCGAPLDVPTGALGVVCPYCKTDNLVSLPAGTTMRTGKDAKQHRRAAAALAELRELQQQKRRDMWAKLIGGVVLVGALALLGKVMMGWDYILPPPASFSATFAPARALVGTPRRVLVPMGRASKPPRTNGDDEWFDYYAGLQRGEYFSIRAVGASSKAGAIISNTSDFYAWHPDAKWHRLPDGTQGLDFRAPYTGLFLVRLALIGNGRIAWSASRRLQLN